MTITIQFQYTPDGKREAAPVLATEGIKTPPLVLIGSADSTVPPELSQKLAGQWGGVTDIKTYPGEDHDLLLHNNSSWTDIASFLRTLEQK